ncbi:hypothetical protein BGLA2_1380012 [Burkholderia gladioli]|nr:hypothetical protein BGLA2_1380012 [Burkholderia gladioli]
MRPVGGQLHEAENFFGIAVFRSLTIVRGGAPDHYPYRSRAW